MLPGLQSSVWKNVSLHLDDVPPPDSTGDLGGSVDWRDQYGNKLLHADASEMSSFTYCREIFDALIPEKLHLLSYSCVKEQESD